MKWFFPSWNGDFRLVDIESSSYRETASKDACVLEIVEATPAERDTLDEFLAEAVKRKWTAIEKVGTEPRQEVLLQASIAEAGKALLARLRPADRTITAVRSESGKLVVHDTVDLPDRMPEKSTAISTARATPCCPQCVPGSIGRASECLLAFLSPEEHATWAAHRYIVVVGGYTGHRYLLAHRHSAFATRIGRICFDLDDECVVHFHDNSVPPEEEILGAKLVLEHREDWLRNQATIFGVVTGAILGIVTDTAARPAEMVFKNPFGDVMDGTWDAGVTRAIGSFLQGLER